MSVRDELIAALRMYGNAEDFSEKSDEQLTNMITGYQKKNAQMIYRGTCPYFVGVRPSQYAARQWEIGCSRKGPLDHSPLEGKHWALESAHQCFFCKKDKRESWNTPFGCRFYSEAQKEGKNVKQKYVCKCGKVFEKDSSSDTTGYRLGLDLYKPGHECYGCHFVVPVEEGYPAKLADYECRASKTITYATTADIPRTRDTFHVAHVNTLDMDFAREIWNYSRGLDGLDDNRKNMDLRGTLYRPDGRFDLTLYFSKTKAGIASYCAISDKFFAGGSTRPDMPEEQEKEIVLRKIRESIEAAKNPQQAAMTEHSVSDSISVDRNIEQITLEINFYKAQTAQNIIEIGRRLLEAKQKLQHGEWLPWLRDKVQFSVVSAQRFMKIAEEFPNTSPVTHLPYTKLLALLQVPESDRDEFIQEAHLVDGQEKTVSEMSRRELDRVIKERDEALHSADELQKACDDAQKKASEALSQQGKSLEKYLTAMEELRTSKGRMNAMKEAQKEDLNKIRELEERIRDLSSRPVEVAVQLPSETDKEKLRREGESSARSEYEPQLKELRRQLEEAKNKARMETGLDQEAIACAAASFCDSLNAAWGNFKVILQLIPGDTVVQIGNECVNHMQGIADEVIRTASIVRNNSLLDEDEELPPEDGMEE
jgi:hypothetical protein